ncbi:uncharacterized protein ARMOST_17743 [Armillaria ostoyae]|uniref:Retrotransposon gag domain-containing protein n=1 Tax=Armillaria ostoyae TaxID=47428 RepID=A0A284RZY5_ARMOS|nr:uncharacterized protein ARMOST_17743 [Armillaria ostoyae]
MSTTFTYPPDAEDGRRKKTPIFSMDDIPASASKENPELFGSASVDEPRLPWQRQHQLRNEIGAWRLITVGGQPSHRETYTHSNFTARHSNLNSKTPNLFNSPRGTSHHRQTGIFNRYRNDPAPETPAPQPTNGGRSDSPDTEDDDKEEPETPTHTPHRRNPDEDPPDNQPGGLNGPGGPGGPNGPNGPGDPGGPGEPNGPGGPNNLPNEQDFLPTAFAMDASKVNYAISFLSGTALDWFEPDILCPNLRNPPAWQHSYAAFLDELRTNFGPFDAIGDAEDALEHLRMRNGDRIMKYMVQFNQYASQVSYGDNSLRHAFYRGLCTRIKDDMAHHGKPNNLHDMRLLAQELDARYWTRRTEISWENRDMIFPDSYPPFSPHSAASTSNLLFSMATPNPPGFDFSEPFSSIPKPYADKLGKDGHLTQEEKDHCQKNNLCIFCGGKHSINDCDKRNPAASASDHNAEVSNKPSMDSAPMESKN